MHVGHGWVPVLSFEEISQAHFLSEVEKGLSAKGLGLLRQLSDKYSRSQPQKETERRCSFFKQGFTGYGYVEVFP